MENTTFTSSSQHMNDKKTSLRYIAITILIIAVSVSVVYAVNYYRRSQPTDRKQCQSGSIDACARVSRQAKDMKDQAISQWENADKKLAWLLSWTNFIHKSEIEKLK